MSNNRRLRMERRTASHELPGEAIAVAIATDQRIPLKRPNRNADLFRCLCLGCTMPEQDQQEHHDDTNLTHVKTPMLANTKGAR